MLSPPPRPVLPALTTPLLVLLLFGAIPFALIPPPLAFASYHLQLPALLLLTLIGTGMLVANPPALRPAAWIPAAVIVAASAFHLANAWFDPAVQWDEAIAWSGIVIVPLAAALCWQQAPDRVAGTLPRIFGALWALHATYGLLQYGFGRQVIGLAGNRNWMAATILSLSPWAIALVVRYRHLQKWPRNLLAASAVTAVTLFLLVQCRSRGAWLALLLYGLFALCWKLRSPRLRALVLLGCLAALTAIAAIAPNRLRETHRKDVRIPVWSATLSIIADHPLSGIGPGPLAFNTALAPYLARTRHCERRVASERILHPHNELLHIGGRLGVPAALAWLAFLLPMLRNPHREPLPLRLAHISASILLLHGMFDKVLVRPPTNLIALVCLGMCLHGMLRPKPPSPIRSNGRKVVLGLIAIISLLLAASATRRHLIVGWHRRAAAIAAAAGDHPRALHHYQAIVARTPADIAAHFEAARMLLTDSRRARQALPHLEAVRRRDPNYASVNALIGIALTHLGHHRQALPYFARQTALYRFSPRALHNHWSAILRAGQLDQLAAATTRVRHLHRWKVDNHRDAEHLRELSDKWLSAVRGRHPVEAVRLATALTEASGNGFTDLSFIPTRGNTDLMHREWVISGFQTCDFAYWQALLERNKTATRPTLTVTLEDTAFRWPHEVLAAGGGTPLEIACTLSWQRSPSHPTPILLRDGRVYLMASGSHQPPRWTDIAHPDAEPVAMTVAPEEIRLFVMPQQFLLRNMILGTVVSAVLPDPPIDLGCVPVVAARSALQRAGHPDANRETIRKAYLAEPFRRLAADLATP